MVGLVVYVGMAKISLVIDQSHSLKEKRMVLRRIRDRVRERLHVNINEVGELDNWQRAELGCAVVSGDRAKALELIDDIVRVAMQAGGAQIFAIIKNPEGRVAIPGIATPELGDQIRHSQFAQITGNCGLTFVGETFQPNDGPRSALPCLY